MDNPREYLEQGMVSFMGILTLTVCIIDPGNFHVSYQRMLRQQERWISQNNVTATGEARYPPRARWPPAAPIRRLPNNRVDG